MRFMGPSSALATAVDPQAAEALASHAQGLTVDEKWIAACAEDLARLQSALGSAPPAPAIPA